MTPPDVFDYSDYRRFLADWMTHRKGVDANYSYRVFSRSVDSKDSGLFINVVEGRRGLRPEKADRWAEALGLTGDEAECFRLLVRFNESSEPDERSLAWAGIVALRTRVRPAAIDEDRFKVLSDWIYAAVRELVCCRGFSEDPKWIADHLEHGVSVAQVEEALELLLRLGMLRREGGKLVVTEVTVTSPESVAGLASFGFHREMHRLAGDALKTKWDPAQRGRDHDIGFFGVIVSLPEDKLPELRKLLWEAQLKVNGWAENFSNQGERVVQVNIQYFPLSKATTDEK